MGRFTTDLKVSKIYMHKFGHVIMFAKPYQENHIQIKIEEDVPLGGFYKVQFGKILIKARYIHITKDSIIFKDKNSITVATIPTNGEILAIREYMYEDWEGEYDSLKKLVTFSLLSYKAYNKLITENTEKIIRLEG